MGVSGSGNPFRLSFLKYPAIDRTPKTAIRIEWPSWPRRRTSKSGRRSRCAARWSPFFCFECGPSRAVRLGLAQWTLEAVVTRRIPALLCRTHPLTQRQPRGHVLFRMQALLHAGRDANSRHPCAPLPYCRTSQFLAASFARRWELLQVLLPLTFTKNENMVDPRGLPAVLFSGTGWVVRSDGRTALHLAAYHGNRRIVGLLIASKAAVDARDSGGCAFPLRHRQVGGRVPARLPCRWTPLHWAAWTGASASEAIAELLMRGADVVAQNRDG